MPRLQHLARYWLARWRIHRGINPVHGDGVHDDAPALQAIIDTGKWPSQVTTHEIARVDVKVVAIVGGGVSLECEHYSLLRTEGPELVKAWVDVLAVGDDLRVTLAVDHETVVRLAADGRLRP